MFSSLAFILLLVSYSNSLTNDEIAFDLHPQSQAIRIKDDLLMNCHARDTSGQDSLEYSWTLNGTSVADKASTFLNHSLYVPMVTTDDLGIYQCIVRVRDERSVVYYSRKALVIETFITAFTMAPKSDTVTLGNHVEMECVTGRSAPPPLIYWTKNGEKVETGVQYNASFGHSDPWALVVQYTMKMELTVTRESVGAYRCVAENLIARQHEVSKPGSLILQLPTRAPFVTEEPKEEIIIAEGQRLVLECPVSGNPTPNITWLYHNLSHDKPSVVSTNETFSIASLRRGHHGNYGCYGNNSLGSVSTRPTLVTVAYLDVTFVRHPTSLTAISGHPAYLSCQPPVGVPIVTVTWYRGTTPVPLRAVGQFAVTSTRRNATWVLEFQSPQQGDAGAYYCVATNAHSLPPSRTSRPASITVIGGPILTQPPIDTSIVKGHTLHLSCLVDGNPFPRVIWYKGDKLITASDRVLLVQSNQQLYISAVDKADEGIYRCLATNVYKNTSATVFVDVIVPAMIKNEIGRVIVIMGDDVVIPCEVAGEPPPVVSWFKGAQSVVLAGGRVSQVSDGLHISSTVTSDAANYTCRAHNSGGVVNNTGRLVVQVRPYIVKNLTDTVVIVNESAVFECHAQGNPAPQLSWFFNMTETIPDGIVITANKSLLSVAMVTWSHVGTYTCVALSPIGNVSSSAYLHIKEGPTVSNISGPLVVGVSQSLMLECHTRGLPAPDIKWQHNGSDIYLSDGRTSFPTKKSILVKLITISDGGQYSCLAQNIVGVVNKTVIVRVFDIPRPPYVHPAEPMSTTSVNISWTSSELNPLSPVIYLLIHYKLSYISSLFTTYKRHLTPLMTSYELDGLLPGKRYTFVMTAVNVVGESRRSNAMEATTYDTAPPAPVGLSVISVGSREVTIGWEAVVIGVTQYQIRYSLYVDDIGHTYMDVGATPPLSYTVADLLPGTSYKFRVRAATKSGEKTVWGEFSAPVNATTKHSEPTVLVHDIEAIDVSSHRIMLQWSRSNGTGDISHYVVQIQPVTVMSPVQTLVIHSPATTATVYELLPWRWYNVTVQAANSVGPGPAGDGLVVRTLPQAPSGSPLNVKVAALSSNIIVVTWEGVSEREANSPINGYYVVYNSSQTYAVRLTLKGDNSTTVHIGSLYAWTVYSVRVAAYTMSVENGTGPYTAAVTVLTLPSLPGQVRDITYNVTVDTVTIAWRELTATNGIMLGYLVSHALTATSRSDYTDLTAIIRDYFEAGFLYSRMPFLTPTVTTVRVNTTGVILHPTLPNSQYQVNVSAVNTVGVGPAVSLIIHTPNIKLTSSTTATIISLTSTSLSPSTPRVLAEGVSQHQFPVVIAGALIAVVVILIIIIFIIYRVCRVRRQRRNLTYYSKEMIEDLQKTYNQDRNVPLNLEAKVSITSPHSSPQNETLTSIHDAPTDMMPSPLIHDTVPHPYTDPLHLSYNSHIVEGIVNPVYDLDQSAPEMMSPDQVYSQSDTMRRKKRMRHETAAAIAAGQNRDLHLVTGDKTMLVDHDGSVVVYRERTAL